jgi:hypothetical protein
MSGTSLVEFLCAISLLLILIFSGYNALDLQRNLSNWIIERTRPEEESNYRLLVVRSYFHQSGNRLRKDPLLSAMPLCFPDLDFGRNPVPDAFSIIQAIEDPVPFRNEGSICRVPAGAPVEAGSSIALAGSDLTGAFGWNFARVMEVTDTPAARELGLEFYLNDPVLLRGSAAVVAIHGFSFANNTLYLVSPAGQNQPFLHNLSEFRYEITSGEIKVFWRKGRITSSFEVEP